VSHVIRENFLHKACAVTHIHLIKKSQLTKQEGGNVNNFVVLLPIMGIPK
jgi:hypothetical protein